jgi:hypothetical protein
MPPTELLLLLLGWRLPTAGVAGIALDSRPLFALQQLQRVKAGTQAGRQAGRRRVRGMLAEAGRR